MPPERVVAVLPNPGDGRLAHGRSLLTPDPVDEPRHRPRPAEDKERREQLAVEREVPCVRLNPHPRPSSSSKEGVVEGRDLRGCVSRPAQREGRVGKEISEILERKAVLFSELPVDDADTILTGPDEIRVGEIAMFDNVGELRFPKRLDELERSLHQINLIGWHGKRLRNILERPLEHALVPAGLAAVPTGRGQPDQPRDDSVDVSGRLSTEQSRPQQTPGERGLDEDCAVSFLERDNSRDRFRDVGPSLVNGPQDGRLAHESAAVARDAWHLDDELRLNRSFGDEQPNDVSRRSEARRKEDAGRPFDASQRPERCHIVMPGEKCEESVQALPPSPALAGRRARTLAEGATTARRLQAARSGASRATSRAMPFWRRRASAKRTASASPRGTITPQEWKSGQWRCPCTSTRPSLRSAAA